MTIRSTLLRVALVGALLVPAVAMAGMSVTGKPKIAFFATGSPGFLDIEGTSSSMTATDDGSTLTFVVPMSTVSTGISMRDDHMNNEYVQIGQYPNATLAIAKSGVTWPAASGEKKSGTVSGNFTVHGVTKPVSVSYTATKTSTGYKVTGKFNFDVAQHGITIPAYLGVTVDPKMKAEVTVDLADAP
jgi:polyisoprenoid-binding protein YceI